MGELINQFGVTPELNQYYSKLFGGKLTIQSPGTSWDVLDQSGYIVFEKGGIKRRLTISDLIWDQGFNGVDDLIQAAKDAWFNPDSNLWHTRGSETLEYIPRYLGGDAEFEERVQHWTEFFGII